ncbi:MAG: lipoprotein signal peptidase [Bacteroidota bacterium]|nr:lipoprotein signal peptidase [Bacteroidota bacterium]
MKKPILIILLILVADQILKFWIKTTMTIGEEIPVFGNWFIIHFTENNGMAFGLQFAGEFGKLALSIFRIIAVIAIGWYLVQLSKKQAKTGLLISLSLIFAGALGNIIDSAFYGLIFSHSSYHSVAEFMPEGGGYASFLHGKVVDMFYFPIIEGTTPTWFPVWPGEPFIFFRPVFNIADSAITTGVVLLIIFQKSFFKKEDKEEIQAEEEDGI